MVALETGTPLCLRPSKSGLGPSLKAGQTYSHMSSLYVQVPVVINLGLHVDFPHGPLWTWVDEKITSCRLCRCKWYNLHFKDRFRFFQVYKHNTHVTVRMLKELLVITLHAIPPCLPNSLLYSPSAFPENLLFPGGPKCSLCSELTVWGAQLTNWAKGSFFRSSLLSVSTKSWRAGAGGHQRGNRKTYSPWNISPK